MKVPRQGPSQQAIDLANLPEPVRSALQRQLEKMPASLREKLLREGSPVLERLLEKVREQAGAGAPLPAASARRGSGDAETGPADLPRHRAEPVARERIPTVMPGDSGSSGLLLLVAAIALIVAGWYAFQG